MWPKNLSMQSLKFKKSKISGRGPRGRRPRGEATTIQLCIERGFIYLAKTCQYSLSGRRCYLPYRSRGNCLYSSYQGNLVSRTHDLFLHTAIQWYTCCNHDNTCCNHDNTCCNYDNTSYTCLGCKWPGDGIETQFLAILKTEDCFAKN